MFVGLGLLTFPTTHEPGAEPTFVPGASSQKLGGILSVRSVKYICQAVWSCFKLELHWTRRLLALAPESVGSSSAARMPIMAMVTSNSVKVNAPEAHGMDFFVIGFMGIAKPD